MPRPVDSDYSAMCTSWAVKRTPACTAGEVELVGDDIAGIAVHIAARVMSLAAPGEVLVSRTIKDLVAGSGLLFEDRGQHTLRGVPDTWQLFAAKP